MQLRMQVLMHVGSQRGRRFEVEGGWVIKCLEGNELRVEEGEGGEGCGNSRLRAWVPKWNGYPAVSAITPNECSS
jgi:hypothetical protein